MGYAMSERLLTIDELARRLGVVRRTVEKNMAAMIAKGLKRVPLGKRLVRFTESSFEQLIARAVEQEEPIF